ncbi:putative late blight resistance protein homolog R1A-10 isoform X2 [Andrographis paniculata]|uniref:putative late blight resistance protein homolog R1A-10 isoform X2 n=1 Tax=Andrographis paniculata TaxID=175694 RepID=UPI0021E7885E|nr:putative late blight resistance protein homolog R1A-10 isoform X2 [Andrographis paniculata]
MAHAALVSLLHTLHNLSRSDHSHTLYPHDQVQNLHQKLLHLQTSLEKIFPVTRDIRDTVSDLESQIRDAVFKSQDTIDYFLSTCLLPPPTPADLRQIISSFDPIAKNADELVDSVKHVRLGTEGTDPFTNEAIASKFTSRSKTTRIVGQEEDFKLVTAELVSPSDDLQIIPIIGMPGIGKTTLARSIYLDRRMEDEFLARAWVTVSPEYNFRDIFTKLLSSIETRGQKGDESVSNLVSRESDEQLAQRLHQTLYDTRYLLVIDDMWVETCWDRLKQYFPDNKNRSRIILTTRHNHIADHVNRIGFRHTMKPLNEENSWILLCDRVFGTGNCPPHLHETGQKISKNCRGLPLSLTVIGGQLSQERKTVEYWTIIERDIYAAVASTDEKESYIEILTLSYNHLPSRLKGCFLYMGGFPEDSELLLSKLTRLWVAEGFLKDSRDERFDALKKALNDSKDKTTLEFVAKRFLEELIDRNLIAIRKFGPDGRIKSCGIHDVLRDIAIKECQKEKFFHGIKRYYEPIPKGAETQRRLSVHKNILMCMEEVYDAAIAVTTARSFLFTGNHHHHPYPYSLDFHYLRVLDALTVFFIEFPDEVARMIHLSYLSLTYNGKIPSSIGKLRNLQALIVRQHPKVIFLGASMLPDVIWSMPELRHLFFTETELPDFSGVDFLLRGNPLLENLQSLSNINATCCNWDVLRRFPNLKKLETWVATPDDPVDFHIDGLKFLEVFKFSVLNPVPEKKIDFRPALAFPNKLRKLSLSGCVIPWDDMSILGQLEHLEVLKLREFAFHGHNEEIESRLDEGTVEEVSVWLPKEEQFRVLKYLMLEGLDLDYWIADDTHFPSLETLIVRHCYDLVEIPSEIGNIACLELIEMIDCSPSCVSSARAIKKEQADINKLLQSVVTD